MVGFVFAITIYSLTMSVVCVIKYIQKKENHYLKRIIDFISFTAVGLLGYLGLLAIEQYYTQSAIFFDTVLLVLFGYWLFKPKDELIKKDK